MAELSTFVASSKQCLPGHLSSEVKVSPARFLCVSTDGECTVPIPERGVIRSWGGLLLVARFLKVTSWDNSTREETSNCKRPDLLDRQFSNGEILPSQVAKESCRPHAVRRNDRLRHTVHGKQSAPQDSLWRDRALATKQVYV